MPIQSDLQNIYEFDGSLADIQTGGLLNVNLLNNGSAPQTGSIISPNGLLSQADEGQTTFFQGAGAAAPVDFLGSGTISTVSVLGIQLFPRPVAVFSSGGQVFFYAPNGLPPLAGVVFSLNINPNAPFDLPDTTVICFARGTQILTAKGERAIETLKAGDRVLTRDNGFQPLRWIGHRHIGPMELAFMPHLCPIRIAAGALGRGRPATDLTLSPQHRVLLRGAETEFVTGATEVLVAAIHLLDLPGVSRIVPDDGIDYWHLMFDNHEILWSNGIESETLFAGPQALRSLHSAARDELLAIFPDLAENPQNVHPRLARPQLHQSEARVLVRHLTRASASHTAGDRVQSVIRH